MDQQRKGRLRGQAFARAQSEQSAQRAGGQRALCRAVPHLRVPVSRGLSRVTDTRAAETVLSGVRATIARSLVFEAAHEAVHIAKVSESHGRY